MRIRTALGSAVVGLTVTAGGVFAAAPAAKHHAMMMPSIKILSVSTMKSHGNLCVAVKVAVSHFKLVKPVYAPPLPMLKGNQGHIHYILGGKTNFVATRDATTKLSHVWCGKAQGVKMGKESVSVYLATGEHTLFPHTMPSTRTVTVK